MLIGQGETGILKANGFAVFSLYQNLKYGIGSLDDIPRYIKHILEHKAWQRRYLHNSRQLIEFEAFEDFLAAPPPEGINTSFDTLIRLCSKDAGTLALLDKEVQRLRGRNWNTENKTIKYPSGNSKQAGIRKLAKYAEVNKEVAEAYGKVLAGEISINRALITTGLRKDNTKPVSGQNNANTKHVSVSVLEEEIISLKKQLEEKDLELKKVLQKVKTLEGDYCRLLNEVRELNKPDSANSGCAQKKTDRYGVSGAN